MRVLFDKLLRLGRDEDGAALVITLALLMFMYLTCAGVFAIGHSVKDRIHLQNACDAAAYSAAVIQADTLSRIATINKAMAWTYVSMTRRQMDYIVYRWSRHAAQHWIDDKAAADEWVQEHTHSTCANPLHKHDVYFSSITFNGAVGSASGGTGYNVVSTDSKFLAGLSSDGSAFATGTHSGEERIKSQLRADQVTIQSMGDAIDALKKKMCGTFSKPGTISDVVQSILLQNVKGENPGDFRYCLMMTKADNYMRHLQNGLTEENDFLGFIGMNVASVFKESGDDEHGWLVRQPTDKSEDFRRGYRGDSDTLLASWNWHATAWQCSTAYGCVPTPYVKCAHPSHGNSIHECRCHTRGGIGAVFGRVEMETKSYADNDQLVPAYKRYYETEETYRARPQILTDDYFGFKGTITVGLARYNENPWYRVFGDAAAVAGAGDKLGGIFAAFNPHKSVEWSWAFSSAKAGYRNKDDEYDGMRKYRVDWDSDKRKRDWNLCVSDWDAVFVPVRSARMKAENGNWVENRNEDFLRGWVEDGSWQPLGGSARHSYAVAGKMPDLPRMHKSGSGLNWKNLADLLYH